jgi:hypothetical protein
LSEVPVKIEKIQANSGIIRRFSAALTQLLALRNWESEHGKDQRRQEKAEQETSCRY